jgi:hypothetical protein
MLSRDGHCGMTNLLAILSAVLSPDICELFHPPLVSKPLSLPLHLRYTLTIERHMTPTNNKKATARSDHHKKGERMNPMTVLVIVMGPFRSS